MTRRIQDVKASIAEIIPSLEIPDFGIKGCFDDFAAFEVFFPEGGGFFGGVAGFEFVLEAGPDDQVDGFGEGGDVACMVEVPKRPRVSSTVPRTPPSLLPSINQSVRLTKTHQ